MESEKEALLFETRLSLFDIISKSITILICIFLITFFISGVTNKNIGGTIFLCLLFIGLLTRNFLSAKTFHLFNDRFVVRRYLLFFFKIDTTIPLLNIKLIYFKNIKGTPGGKYLCIKTYKKNFDFKENILKDKKDELINTLTSLNIKVKSDYA
jgi:hypothetical protein